MGEGTDSEGDRQMRRAMLELSQKDTLEVLVRFDSCRGHYHPVASGLGRKSPRESQNHLGRELIDDRPGLARKDLHSERKRMVSRLVASELRGHTHLGSSPRRSAKYLPPKH